MTECASRLRVRGTGAVIGATAVAWLLAILLVLTFAYPMLDRTLPVPVAHSGPGSAGLLSKDAGAPPMAERRGPAEAVIVDGRRERSGSASTSGPDTPQAVADGVPSPDDASPQTRAGAVANRHPPSHARHGFEARAPPVQM